VRVTPLLALLASMIIPYTRTWPREAAPRLRIWRSAGRAGRCRTLGSRSGRTPLPGGERSCCRLSSVAAAAVSPVPCGGRGCPQRRACGLPMVGRPPPVSTQPDSRAPLAASTWQLDQRRRTNPTCPVLPSRRNGGCGSAAVLPQPDTAAGVWVAAEPDTADALAVRCCSRNRRRCPEGRCPDGWCLDGWCPPRTLPEPVGVHRYRKQSPARRPLDGCRHRRYAWAS
jgi:hypothetical protein